MQDWHFLISVVLKEKSVHYCQEQQGKEKRIEIGPKEKKIDNPTCQGVKKNGKNDRNTLRTSVAHDWSEEHRNVQVLK